MGRSERGPKSRPLSPDTPNSATIHPARPNPITFTVLPDRGVWIGSAPRLDLPQPNVLWGDKVNGIQSGISFAPVDHAANQPNHRMVFKHWIRKMTVRPFGIPYRVLAVSPPD